MSDNKNNKQNIKIKNKLSNVDLLNSIQCTDRLVPTVLPLCCDPGIQLQRIQYVTMCGTWWNYARQDFHLQKFDWIDFIFFKKLHSLFFKKIWSYWSMQILFFYFLFFTEILNLLKVDTDPRLVHLDRKLYWIFSCDNINIFPDLSNE